jgi:hypothetical protein
MIERVFHTKIVSEFEPQFWGFESQEEWDKFQEERKKEDEDRFYAELMKFLAGEPHQIGPTTVGMAWAKIALELVTQNPELATPAYKSKLLEEIHEVEERRIALRNASDGELANESPVVPSATAEAAEQERGPDREDA